MPEVERFNHLGHCVRDLDVAVRFYTEVLGFRVLGTLHPSGDASATLLRLPPPVEMTAVYMKREGLVLELLHFRSPEAVGPGWRRKVNEPGLTHVSFTVDDIDAVCARVAEHGGRVLAESRLPGAVFVEDPDGQMLELLKPAAKLLDLLDS